MKRNQTLNKLMDAFKGVVIAVPSSLLVAILFAYFFRIPIPLSGYIGPFGEFSSYDTDILETVESVIVAWVFYGIFGGFIILTICGAITGIYTGHKYSQSSNKNKMIMISSVFIGAAPVFILSILDYIIGPW